ncbi:MAG: response regulator [Desulfuromonadaceae bacterium]|nr:response regulator [Desulfuromonadaceae bacterium]
MIIMTVDDSRSVRLMVALTLKQAGHQVVEAASGEEALERLKAEKIDLIVCDINMPGMDGNQLVQRVKGIQEYSSIPIIMLTTENAQGKLAEAKKAGAFGWMNKPFKAEQLIAAVKTVADKLCIS